MTTTIKTTLLTGLFSLCLLTGLQAQDKYEFAKVQTLMAGTNADGIYIYINGKQVEKIDVKWKKVTPYASDFTPLLDQIQKMSDEGWEIITVDGGFYYLKRKKS